MEKEKGDKLFGKRLKKSFLSKKLENNLFEKLFHCFVVVLYFNFLPKLLKISFLFFILEIILKKTVFKIPTKTLG